jgi:hypothetical protein
MDLGYPLKRHLLSEGKPLLVKHHSIIRGLDPGFAYPFDVKIEVPFAVRKCDIAFSIHDGFDNYFPCKLEIDGITDGEDITNVTDELSHVFRLYFDPPKSIQGSRTVRIKQNSRQIYDSVIESNLVINMSFYNEF